MSSEDVKGYIDGLRRHNLIYLNGGPPRDLTVVDQFKGPVVPCDWIHFEKIDWEGDSQKRISVCKLSGSCTVKVLTPDGWNFDKSLSNNL
jgi:hypothetical protein